jgi:hypothetical protein
MSFYGARGAPTPDNPASTVPNSLRIALASGPHGSVWSSGEAVLAATWLHWALIGRVLAGNTDGLPFALAFLTVFGVGLSCVWLTERGRKPVS